MTNDTRLKSEFDPRIVRIGAVERHPGADTLSITNVEGNPVVMKTGSFTEGDLAVYIPVDALVPTNLPEFSFLAKEGKTHHRIRAAKLRGVFSMGLLVSISDELAHALEAEYGAVYPDDQEDWVGVNVAEQLSILKYETPEERATSVNLGGTKSKAAQSGLKLPVYGLDSMRKYEGSWTRTSSWSSPRRSTARTPASSTRTAACTWAATRSCAAPPSTASSSFWSG